jgi:hypothetical protein
MQLISTVADIPNTNANNSMFPRISKNDTMVLYIAVSAENPNACMFVVVVDQVPPTTPIQR